VVAILGRVKAWLTVGWAPVHHAPACASAMRGDYTGPAAMGGRLCCPMSNHKKNMVRVVVHSHEGEGVLEGLGGCKGARRKA
jgi:hypothetical protein